MTREEAIELCDAARKTMYFPETKEYISDFGYALEIAIKALEQQPCEDAISRSEAIRVASGYCHWSNIPYELAKLPSVSTEKTGHNCNEDYADCDQFVCSECGIELQDWNRVERDEDDGEISYHEYTFNYCPNCGARMREAGETD